MKNTPKLPDEELSPFQRQAAELEALRAKCERVEGALEAIQQRNRVLGVSAPFGILTIDPDGRVTGMNIKMREMLPWPPHDRDEDLNIFGFDALIKAGITDDFRRCWLSKQTIIRDHRCVQAHDRCLQLRVHMSPISDETGAHSGVMAFVENQTDLRQAQDAARESEERYRVLFQSAPVPMIERDVSEVKSCLEALRQSGISDLGAYLRLHPEEIRRCLDMVKTLDCNDAFLRLLETDDKNALLAKMPRFVVGEDFLKMAEEGILMLDQGTFPPDREMTIETLQGKRKRIMCQYMLLSDHENTRVIISLVDITEGVEAEKAVRASEQHFREQSLRDNLTGLYNRRFLYQSLPGLVRSARHTQACLSLLFMDMDNFKDIVDAHGHLNGSRAIQEVAGTIRDAIETPCYAVAYAGDEFVVVLPNHGPHEAGKKALQILSQIRATAYLSSQGKAVRLQASCGVASFPSDADAPEALLAAADTALFAVKRTGKGTIRYYADVSPRIPARVRPSPCN